MYFNNSPLTVIYDKNSKKNLENKNNHKIVIL